MKRSRTWSRDTVGLSTRCGPQISVTKKGFPKQNIGRFHAAILDNWQVPQILHGAGIFIYKAGSVYG